MIETLDRYQKCSYGTLEVNRSVKENEVKRQTKKNLVMMMTMMMLMNYRDVDGDSRTGKSGTQRIKGTLGIT
ncbi:hypothetical protein K7X08_019436 [Anisodus acutangulus]|uniref:Uncharacterized protein n=1 Tax=Anisodus acutangulus TaxID=402998 RepID=A0A9Q1MV78_9SOLA|nr:hypothetical protein K7X08_019436 [Anisodus acutangulus]